MHTSLHRRQVLRGLAGVSVLPFLPTPSRAEGSRPNVLFIAIDDLNDWSGILGGHPQAKTPHLDALAARGRSFTQAHAAAPACNPSRTAVLTGVAPYRSGVYSNDAAWWEALGDVATLPALFRTHGYRTLGAGKVFHFGDPGAWDEHLGDTCVRMSVDEGGRPKPADAGSVGELHWGPSRSNDEGIHPDERVAAWVARQLSRPGDAPFFLACGFHKPHLPWFTPKRFFDAIDLPSVKVPDVPKDEMDDIPKVGVRLAHLDVHKEVVKSDQWQAAVRGYLAALSFTDDMLGRVIAALDASPARDNTLVVLWSDHGWSLGEKFHWKKFALWEECTRVPFVIAGPGISPGESGRVVGLLDIYPTLAQLCGLPRHARVDGRDLRPLLDDPHAPWPYPCITSQSAGNHAVRTQRWRYIRYHDGGEELYDHQVDPGEHTNLAGRADLSSVLGELRAMLPVSPAPESADVTTEKCRPVSPR